MTMFVQNLSAFFLTSLTLFLFSSEERRNIVIIVIIVTFPMSGGFPVSKHRHYIVIIVTGHGSPAEPRRISKVNP